MNYKGVNHAAHMADGSVLILLERKSGKSLATIIDAADWENVRGHRWHADKKGNSFYVKAHARRIDGARTTVFLHQLLLPSVDEIDHSDCNGLNNKRNSLRPASHAQNLANRRKCKNGHTSKFKGVNWHNRCGNQAQIRVDGRKKHLGYFASNEAAARAYDRAALKYFGELARLNFPTKVG